MKWKECLEGYVEEAVEREGVGREDGLGVKAKSVKGRWMEDKKVLLVGRPCGCRGRRERKKGKVEKRKGGVAREIEWRGEEEKVEWQAEEKKVVLAGIGWVEVC